MLRDETEERALHGGDFTDFEEAFALNRTLQEDDRSYELFKRVHAKNPVLASICFPMSLNLLVQHGDYELCRGYIKDPIGAFEKIRQMREKSLSAKRANPKIGNP